MLECGHDKTEMNSYMYNGQQMETKLTCKIPNCMCVTQATDENAE